MKSKHEITAIPKLLKVLELTGCIVTIDAMGCQKEIVKLISEREADYIITLKKNQGSLYKDVEQLFKEAISTGFEGFEHSTYKTQAHAHGREEIRHYLMLTNIQSRIDPKQKWENLNSVGLVEYVRTINGKTTVETRYFISSLPNNAKLLEQSVRSHWGVENSLHWGGVSAGEVSPAVPPLLDVALGEEECRIRKDNAPQNFAVLRRIAVNLLGREKSSKLGVKNKQFRAAMDNDYLVKVLST